MSKLEPLYLSHENMDWVKYNCISKQGRESYFLVYTYCHEDHDKLEYIGELSPHLFSIYRKDYDLLKETKKETDAWLLMDTWLPGDKISKDLKCLDMRIIIDREELDSHLNEDRPRLVYEKIKIKYKETPNG